MKMLWGWSVFSYNRNINGGLVNILYCMSIIKIWVLLKKNSTQIILTTGGATHALSYSFQAFVHPGDEVCMSG